MSSFNKKDLSNGFKVAIPLMIGFFPIGMAFGILAKNSQVSFLDTSLFSILVYAGASQFMAIDLIMANVSTIQIVFATFLLNLRHLIMSASLSPSLKKVNKKFLPFIAYGITDETFSVISFNKEKISTLFLITLTILSASSWTAGTMVGYLVGEVLPQSLQTSLNIGLYAMFAALLTPEIKQSKKLIKVILITLILYTIIYHFRHYYAGWDIIITIIIASIIAAALD